jgi:hypothetical protein
MKLLFTSKNTRMKSHLMELMAAMALYSKAGYKYVYYVRASVVYESEVV